MIGGVGAQTGYYTLQQASQAQAAASKLDLFSDAADGGDDASTTSTVQNSSNTSSASGPGAGMLSSTTLASLLGLQMVNGQAQGGASGAQLNLPQTTMPSGTDPNSLLSAQTLQMLQSIGS